MILAVFAKTNLLLLQNCSRNLYSHTVSTYPTLNQTWILGTFNLWHRSSCHNPSTKYFSSSLSNKMGDCEEYVPPSLTTGPQENGGGNKKPKGGKRLSVERIYQKKSQLEHILLRPDTYIGSVHPVTEKMWILDEDTKKIVNREITYVPGFYKMFDEILVNAADNKQRDKKMDTIRIDIKPEENQIKIYNNGKGIPIVHHKDEKMYVPTMIFGHLLTSSNFNDEEQKVTGGRNGFGAKLCNVFSTKFTVETACKESRKEFKQSWSKNMSKAGEPRIKDFGDRGQDYTRITYNPDLEKFKMNSLDRVYNNGKGIPVVQHKDEKMYVPTMIFGHLLTSSNFNDEEQKTTGGRNGFGAKLCNVFSTKFTVETANKESKQEFKQTWGNNMSRASDPRIKPFEGEDFTRITFSPDLEKFQMTSIDKDTVALLSRRAYDIAASAHGGVKVYLNGTKIPVKGFKDYVDLFLKDKEDETGAQIKCLYEKCGERWEIAVAPSSDGFQQMSFVNSIATTKGGRHVEHVEKLVSNILVDKIKSKNKSGLQIKAQHVKNHLWVFVNCLIVNPTFDSQTKENMTSQANTFGSKCVLSDKFKQNLAKTGIVESVLAWTRFKQDQQQKGKLTGKKTNKLKGIPKLDDANDAGTKNSVDCTLILTEGDSAKTMAVAGVSVVGRDKYGIYPLKGKILNVREATHKQIMENKEINELVKIVGLQYKKKYESIDDIKSLRYGRVMVMTDQDQDGSHIKGLLINFIHHNWPGLLRLPFLEQFITPIVKVTKKVGGEQKSFYSIPEHTEWKAETVNWHQWNVKYYKGLGTSTNKEAKEYFTDMLRHRIKFAYQNEIDDHAINLAFSKKMIEERKRWLTDWMEEGKRRKDLGLPEVYLYEKNTRNVTYSDFVNKELVLFSNMDNERSIPSLVDGFKPGQRKVMFTCIKRNDKNEIKVAQLAGSVGEKSAYHHGEASLMGTIINLAQNYVGSNNINLLVPEGQFGSRGSGGKDAASPRYIFTKMSPLARHIFNPKDDSILKYLQDDNKKVEPEWYIPIIPMVLVNGTDGIGTGWMTKIPNYNPREIVQYILQLIDGKSIEDLKPLVPWYKGFKGTIEQLDYQRYVVNGEVAEISDTKIEITELPVKVWTQHYKESVMETMLNGSEKVKAQIQDYKEYHTDTSIKFVVQMSEEEKRKADLDKGLHAFFKLQTQMSISSMVLFDKNGCIKKYDDVRYILQDFFDLRMHYYEKRKNYMEGMLGAEALKLSNQARFIMEKCDGSLIVENKKRKAIVAELVKKNFDPDPIAKWKKASEQEMEDSQSQEGNADGSDLEDGEKSEDAKADEYNYLMSMAMWSLTQEKKEDLLRKRDEKRQELENLKKTTKEDLWRDDLTEFVKKLDEVEQKELEDEQQVVSKKVKGGPKGRGTKKAPKVESMPSPHGIRVVPKISDELRKKVSAIVAQKEKKAAKNAFGKSLSAKMAEFDEPDEFDDMADDKEHNRSLSDRLGFNIKAEEKLKKAVKTKKEGSGARKTGKKGKKDGKCPWESASNGSGSNSDYGMGGSVSDVSDAEFDSGKYGPPAIDRPGRERKTIKYDFDESDDSLKDNSEIESPPRNGHSSKHMKVVLTDSEDSDKEIRQKNVKLPTKQAKIDSMFSAEAKTKKEDGDNGNAFDNLLGDESSNSVGLATGNPTQNGTTDGMKNGGNPYDSDSDDFAPKQEQEKKEVVTKKPAPSNKPQFDFSDSDSFGGDEVGQASSDDEFVPSKKKLPTKRKLPEEKKKFASKKAAPIKEKEPNVASKNDSSNDEEVVKASPVQPEKNKPKGRTKKLLIATGSDDSDFGTTVAKSKKPKKPSADKPPAAKKAKVAKPKALPKKKIKAAFSGSSDEGSGSGSNFNMDTKNLSDFDTSEVIPARDRPGRARKAVANYNFGDDSDSDGEFA